MKLLKDLYGIYSPSYQEQDMLKFIGNYLDANGIEYKADKYGQIYGLRGSGLPCVVAHTDQVSSYGPVTKLYKTPRINRNSDKPDWYIFGDSGLGADDKNGIWIILKMLTLQKTGKIDSDKFNFNFVFSRAEECGSHMVGNLKKVFKQSCYAIILDRKNAYDIIGERNDYCTKAFDTAISSVLGRLGYSSTTGSISDANVTRHWCNSVNISVGYYEPHTATEYTIWSDLNNALLATVYAIKHMRRDWPKVQLVEKTKKWIDGKLVDVYEKAKPIAIIESKYAPASVVKCTVCGAGFPEYNYRFCAYCGGRTEKIHAAPDKIIAATEKPFKYGTDPHDKPVVYSGSGYWNGYNSDDGYRPQKTVYSGGAKTYPLKKYRQKRRDRGHGKLNDTKSTWKPSKLLGMGEPSFDWKTCPEREQQPCTARVDTEPFDGRCIHVKNGITYTCPHFAGRIYNQWLGGLFGEYGLTEKDVREILGNLQK